MPIRATGGRRHLVAVAAGALLSSVVLSACSGQDQGSNVDPDQVDTMTAPAAGACRLLTPGDLEQVSNASATVECSQPHTAETFEVGELPASFADAEYDAPELATIAYERCGKGFMEFLGADESLAMRTVLSWVMFRPSQEAWGDGARWYRCDIVGGIATSPQLVALPDTAADLLTEPDDAWLACVKGRSVNDEPRVPCTEDHTYRAVTTIKLGKPEDPYPGDDDVESRTRAFCSDSVAAWLGYPVTYSFGYTWFLEPEWEAGNRRSVCWAKTDQ